MSSKQRSFYRRSIEGRLDDLAKRHQQAQASRELTFAGAYSEVLKQDPEAQALYRIYSRLPAESSDLSEIRKRLSPSEMVTLTDLPLPRGA